MKKSNFLKSLLQPLAFAASLGAGLSWALPMKDIPVKAHEGTIPADSIAVNTFLSKDTLWIMNGYTIVKAGVTLTIEAGTTIQASTANRATLLVDRGAWLIAAGTKDQPITFRGEIGSERGTWGGIVLLGKGISNQGGNLQYEALGWARFGNNKNDDSSGVLTYVRLDGPGFPIAVDRELNGVTLCAVGSKTVMHHVQVHRGDDDGFEWFGGSVNADHLVVTQQTDDNFDIDHGYSGTIDYMIGIQRTEAPRPRQPGSTLPFEPVGDFVIECSSSQSDLRPLSNLHWSHLTLIDNGGYDGAVDLKEQCAGTYEKMVIVAGGAKLDSASGWGFRIQGDLTAANITAPTPALELKDVFLTGNWKKQYEFAGLSAKGTDSLNQVNLVKDVMNAKIKNYPYATTHSFGLYKDLSPSNPDIIAAKAGAIVDGDLWYKGWTLDGTMDFPLGDDPVPPNAGAPVVTLTRTGADLSAPASFTLNATATDPEGIANLEILQGVTVLASSTTGSVSFDVTNAASGSITYTVRAKDKHPLNPLTQTQNLVVVVANPAPTVDLTRTGSDNLVAPASFTLNATASDLDGIATLEILQGSTILGSNATGSLGVNVTNLAQGIYTYKVQAKDINADQKTSSKELIVVVQAPPPNKAPVVNLSRIGETILVAPAGFTLNATASDSDGVISNLQILEGSTVLGNSVTGSLSVPVSGVTAGNHTYTVKATDNHATEPKTSSKDLIVSVEVPPPNKAPIVNLTRTGETLIAPAGFTLNATASDPDGAIASLQILEGTTVLGGSNTGSLAVSISGKVPGTYTYTVKATDNHATDPKTVTQVLTVTVFDPPALVNASGPTVDLKLASNDSLVGPANFTLVASADDADGIDTLQVLLDGKVVASGSSVSLVVPITKMVAGVYTYTVRAKDKHATDPKVTTKTLIVTVNAAAANIAPKVTLIRTGAETLIGPANFQLLANAEDVDGIDSLQVLLNGKVLATGTSINLVVPVANLDAGTYTYIVRAKDKHINDPLVKIDSLVVNVNAAAPNIAPTMSFIRGGADTLYAPSSFSLVALASDQDGIDTIQITLNGVVLGTSTNGTLTVPLTGKAAGTYTYVARAKDKNSRDPKETKSELVVVIKSMPVAIAIPLRDFNGIHVFASHGQNLVIQSSGFGSVKIAIWSVSGHFMGTREVNLKQGQNSIAMGNLHGVHIVRLSNGKMSRSARVVFSTGN